MKSRKLTKSEFAFAIRNGLGSAFLHVKEYGDLGVEEELLEACLTNMVYDVQLDRSRASWLAFMLDRTGNVDSYVKQVVDRLDTGVDLNYTDLSQLLDICVELFNRGFSHAGASVLLFAQRISSWEYGADLGSRVVRIGSLSGFKLAVKMMVQNCQSSDWGSFYENACEILELSPTTVKNILRDESATNPEFAAFVAKAEEWDELWEGSKSEKGPERTTWTFLEVSAYLDSDQRGSGFALALYGRNAPEEELQTLLKRIDHEVIDWRLSELLQVFRDRPLPVVAPGIEKLLCHENRMVRHWAMTALAHTSSGRMRDLALTCLQSVDEVDVRQGLHLLRKNWKASDAELVKAKIALVSDPELFHGCCGDVLAAYKNYGGAEFHDLLAWIYENCPCGFDRAQALEAMIDQQIASIEVLFEAQWDSSEDVRAAARAEYVMRTVINA